MRILVTAALVLALCPVAPGCKSDPDARRNRLLAGCKTDKDCPKGMRCEGKDCRKPAQEAKKPATPPPPAAPPPNTADLTIRICPGYWGKSHNTGTLIAKNKATGKQKFLAITQKVPDGDFEDEFVFEDLPYGTWQVQYFYGVISMGRQDTRPMPCAEKMPCGLDKKTRIIRHGPPLPKAEWEAKMLRYRKDHYPGTEGCPKGYECDTDVLRQPCDFDVDREI